MISANTDQRIKKRETLGASVRNLQEIHRFSLKLVNTPDKCSRSEPSDSEVPVEDSRSQEYQVKSTKRKERRST